MILVASPLLFVVLDFRYIKYTSSICWYSLAQLVECMQYYMRDEDVKLRINKRNKTELKLTSKRKKHVVGERGITWRNTQAHTPKTGFFGCAHVITSTRFTLFIKWLKSIISLQCAQWIENSIQLLCYVFVDILYSIILARIAFIASLSNIYTLTRTHNNKQSSMWRLPFDLIITCA